MYAVSSSRTMANARYIKPVDRDAERRKYVAEEWERRIEKYKKDLAILNAQKAVADAAIKAANRRLREINGSKVSLFSDIIRRVSRAHRVSPALIKGRSRAKPVVFARQACVYWAVRRTGMSINEIALRMGLDNSTARHAVKAYAEKRAFMGRNLKRIL